MKANKAIELGQRSASNHKEGTLHILCNLEGPITHHCSFYIQPICCQWITICSSSHLCPSIVSVVCRGLSNYPPQHINYSFMINVYLFLSMLELLCKLQIYCYHALTGCFIFLSGTYMCPFSKSCVIVPPCEMHTWFSFSISFVLDFSNLKKNFPYNIFCLNSELHACYSNTLHRAIYSVWNVQSHVIISFFKCFNHDGNLLNVFVFSMLFISFIFKMNKTYAIVVCILIPFNLK